MVTVEEAEKIILNKIKSYGTETVSFEKSLGRVLAEDIIADRDFPPAHRSTMDGIAINFSSFEKGITSYKIMATIAAGDKPIEINAGDECVEIMTGAALPSSTDTIVPYENIVVKDGIAAIMHTSISKGQSIHAKGKDKKRNDVVAYANKTITPALIALAASVGKQKLTVKKLPRTIIISSGDEMVEVRNTPSPYQLRQSNGYMINAVLQSFCLYADMQHLPDDPDKIKEALSEYVEEYDVLILSGGVSMGKFDYVHHALEAVSVKKLFHKVQQRPGKPFWFGEYKNEKLVFAFPGNPVAVSACLYRYFLPWLVASMGLTNGNRYAILNEDFTFTPNLTYFLQVQIKNEEGKLLATPFEGNGSGDFSNLMNSHAFMELPAERNNFTKGEVLKVWFFKS